MARHAKGTLQLVITGRFYDAEARVRASPSGKVAVSFYRVGKGGPVMVMPLDEAQAFQRALQGAVDEAYRRAKAAQKGGA